MHQCNVKLAAIAAHHLADMVEEERDAILALAELQYTKEGAVDVEVVELLLGSDKLAKLGSAGLCRLL